MSSSSHRGHGSSHMSSAVLSFFVALFLSLEVVLVSVFLTVFFQGGFLSVLDDDYYQYVYNYANEQALYYTLPTGYDEAVVNDIFTVSEVRSDVRDTVNAAFHGTTFTPIDTTIHQRIIDNVSAIYARDGVEFNDEAKGYAETYADEIVEIYRKAVKMPGIEQLGALRSRFMLYILIAMAGLALLILILSIALVGTRHYKHRGLRYVAYATGGASLMTFIAPAALLASGVYKGLNLSPQFFYHFGVSLIERLAHLCLIGSGVCLVVTVVLIVQIAKMRNKLVKRHKRVI